MLRRLGFLVVLWALLQAACTPSPGIDMAPAVTTGITGTIRDGSGGPVSGATVYVYRNARSTLRGPADFAADSDPRGHYLLDLAPGSYHLVARLRSDGGASGPPRPGDAWALPTVNPVTLAEGELHQLDFTLVQVQQQPLLTRTLADSPYQFSGTLVNPHHNEVEGAVVLAYRKAELHRRPDFASPPSGPEGRFAINLPDPGPWCLVFRQNTRGQLRTGELSAQRGREAGQCQLEAGEQTDLGEIMLSPFTENGIM